MRIITISREFGSGGRELGKRLADELGWDYYDREIITAIASSQGLNEGYVEKALESNVWRSYPMTFRASFSIPDVMQAAQTRLLTAQRNVIENIAAAGRDCIIVGRNADAILAEYKPFSLFVCADMAAKVKRCMDRASADENLTPKEMERNIRRIDKGRAQSREIITGSKWGQAGAYHLIVNTTGWEIKALTPAVADFARRFFER